MNHDLIIILAGNIKKFGCPTSQELAALPALTSPLCQVQISVGMFRDRRVRTDGELWSRDDVPVRGHHPRPRGSPVPSHQHEVERRPGNELPSQ